MTYEQRPSGELAEALQREAPRKGRVNRERLIAEAEKRGDEVIEHSDGRLELRAKRTGKANR